MMSSQIKSEEEYTQSMEKIESYLQTVTKRGGFHLLDAGERDELQHLSKMAEAWEDDNCAMAHFPSSVWLIEKP